MKTELFALFTGFMVLGTVVPAFPESRSAGVTPVRGVVASISDDTLTVRSHTGLVQIHTGSPLQVYRDIPSELAHVKSASFVGVTSIKRPDGSESAKEIHIFPEELRGTGEGSYLLDQDHPNPEGNSRMTNGTVSQSRMTNGTVSGSRMTNGTVSGSRMTNGTVSQSRMTNGTVNARPDASTLTIHYGGGAQTISVPPDVPVTVLTLNTEPLKPGQNVVALAMKQPDGSLTATRVISRGNGSAK
jgi:Domain of unknown function (DUF5666)